VASQSVDGALAPLSTSVHGSSRSCYCYQGIDFNRSPAPATFRAGTVAFAWTFGRLPLWAVVAKIHFPSAVVADGCLIGCHCQSFRVLTVIVGFFFVGLFIAYRLSLSASALSFTSCGYHCHPFLVQLSLPLFVLVAVVATLF
jgi:hypothetical protein